MLDADLKLETIFQEIFRARRVSLAAEKHPREPADVSVGLAKLRRRFNDPLFVCTSAGVEPTPLASELLTPGSETLGLLRYALRHQVLFDPEKTERYLRHFRKNGIGQQVLFRLYQCANMLYKTGTRAVETEGLTTQRWAVLGAPSRPKVEAG